jgi:predicted lipase
MQPLDSKLALTLGHLVETAYQMWDAAKKLPFPESLTPPAPDPLPGGYRMQAWIQMADFAFGSQEKRFYGFIAVDEEGRAALVIRGTEGWIEWYDDAVAWLTPFRQVPNTGLVSVGFDKIYSSLQAVRYTPEVHARVVESGRPAAPLPGTFVQQVDQVLDATATLEPRALVPGVEPGAPQAVVDVTGHSLGAALCTLYAIAHSADSRHALSTICTFASPRVGNTAFVGAFDRLPLTSWRIVNDQDFIPKLPPHIPLVLDYQHVNEAYAFTSAGMTTFSPTCWHDMGTYLHYLDTHEPLKQGCLP